MTLIVKGICRGCGATVSPDQMGVHRASHDHIRISSKHEHQTQIAKDREAGILPAQDKRTPFKHRNQKEP
jgi:hypothetical protein